MSQNQRPDEALPGGCSPKRKGAIHGPRLGTESLRVLSLARRRLVSLDFDSEDFGESVEGDSPSGGEHQPDSRHRACSEEPTGYVSERPGLTCTHAARLSR